MEFRVRVLRSAVEMEHVLGTIPVAAVIIWAHLVLIGSVGGSILRRQQSATARAHAPPPTAVLATKRGLGQTAIFQYHSASVYWQRMLPFVVGMECVCPLTIVRARQDGINPIAIQLPVGVFRARVLQFALAMALVLVPTHVAVLTAGSLHTAIQLPHPVFPQRTLQIQHFVVG